MIRITACQTKKDKSSERNLEACIKWIEDISQNVGTELICFGEMYPFGFDVAGSLEESVGVSLLRQACRENRSKVLVGFIERYKDQIRNLSVFINQRGEIAHKHAKDIK
jgi:predicted amidohydrolase